MPAAALTLGEFQQLLERMSTVAGARAGIGVRDAEVAAYARVLEFGSVVGAPPWPRPGARTTVAVDPRTGTQVVVSVQAPQGFIRVRTAGFAGQVRQRLRKPLDWLDAAAVEAHLDTVVRDAAGAVLEELRAAAPRDSGRLRESLALVED